MARPTISAMGLILVATISFASCGGYGVTDSPTLSSANPSPAGSLVITRTGGIAGVNDVVQIAADGTAQMTSKSGETHACTPSRTALDQLRAIDLAAVGSAPSKPIPDGFTYEVRSASGTASAGQGDAGIRAELVAAAAAVIASCLDASGSAAPYE
jgi:hypothetical protein